MASDIIFGILTSLTPLVVIGAVVAAIVLSRRGREADEEPGIGTVRRLFLYGIALVSAGFAAWGVGTLIGGAADTLISEEIIEDRGTGLALGLSFVFVGGPVWVAAWLVAGRTLTNHPVEARSLARRLYFALVRGVALSIMVFSAVEAGRQLLQVDPFAGQPWGQVIAWSTLWAFHEWTLRTAPAPTEPTRTIDRLYRYYGAVLGLAVLAAGAALLLYEGLQRTYDELFIEAAAIVRDDAWADARGAFVLVVVGGVAWSWHWLRQQRADEASLLRLAYLFLFGILGGAAASLIAGSTLLYYVLQWFFGDPDAVTAAAHFDATPGALAALVVGAGVWGYHQAEVHEHPGLPGEERRGPGRLYRYLIAAAGLVTLAGGLVTLFATAIDLVVPDPADLIRADEWWRNQLVLAVTLLLVGAPVWARYWWDAQRHVDAPGERDALSRRAYLFGIFGAAALAALINLVIVLFQFLDALFEGTLGWEVAHDSRWSLAILITAGAIGVYYWLVLREDQRVEAVARPAPAARAPEVLLFAPGDGVALGEQIGSRLGGRVRVQHRLDRPGAAAALSDEQVAALVTRIGSAGAERVAVMLEPDGRAEVIPYSPAGA